MSRKDYRNISVIREIRLRRWARVHYVPADKRPSNWNSIVLEEMGIRDQELENQEMNDQMLASQFVPLAPTSIHILHPAHAKQNEPKLLQSHQQVKRQMEEL